MTIPAGAPGATLSFWWHPISAEGPLAAAAAAQPDLAALEQALAGSAPREVLAGDRQYVLVLDTGGRILKTLLWTRSNARAWQHATFDLTPYRGLSVRLAFGAYNDGDGRRTAMYVDDVSLTACWPPPLGPTPTPTATATSRPPARTYLPLVLKRYAPPVRPTPTRTPTPTPTSTHAHDADVDPDTDAQCHVDRDTDAQCHADRDTDAQRHVDRDIDLNRTPDILQARWLRSLVVEPGKTGRLWGITNEGYLMRSADRGATWETMPQPDLDGMPLRPSYVGMDYNHPATLYLGAIADGLWRSTDAGLSWEKRHPIFAGPVTVGLSDPSVLWIGTWDSAYRPLARSSDAGLTWASAGQGMSAQDNVTSPILIDPQVRNVVYSLAMGPRGTATLYRSFDSIWEGIPAPINQPYGYASPGLMLDGAARDLYVGSPDRTLYASSNAYTPVRDDVTWRPVHTFDHQPIPLAVGTGPNGPALYITLSDHNGDGRAPGRTLRSDDGGSTWTLLTIPPPDLPSTSTPTPTPTRTAIAPTPTPTPTATPLTPPVTPAACYEGMLNGGFETTGGWVIRSNPVLAAYVKTPVQGGAASMRTGIPAGGANVSSYSPIEQAVTFPDGLASAKLSFWRYNVNGDVAAGAAQKRLTSHRRSPPVRARSACSVERAIPAAHRGRNGERCPAGGRLLLRHRHPQRRNHRLAVHREHQQTILAAVDRGCQPLPGTNDPLPVRHLQQRHRRCQPHLCGHCFASALPAGRRAGAAGRMGGPGDRPAGDGHALRRGRGPALPFERCRCALAPHGHDPARPRHPQRRRRTRSMRGMADRATADRNRRRHGAPPTAARTWQQLPAVAGLKPLAAHPSNPNRLYPGVCDGPYLSTDGGATVKQHTDPLFGLLDSWAIAPAGEEWQEIWVGGVSEGGGGAVLVSRDGGATWSRSTPLGLDMGWYGDLKLDRYLLGWVYAATYNGFFYGYNDGETWLKHSEGLEDVIGGVHTDGRPYGLLSLMQAPAPPGASTVSGNRARPLHAQPGGRRLA